MLIVLTVLVITVLLMPPLLWVDTGTEDMAEDFLDNKKTILSIILTVF